MLDSLFYQGILARDSTLCHRDIDGRVAFALVAVRVSPEIWYQWEPESSLASGLINTYWAAHFSPRVFAAPSWCGWLPALLASPSPATGAAKGRRPCP